MAPHLRIAKKVRWVCVSVFVGSMAFAASPQAAKPTPAAASPIKVVLRRITETQYRHTIADVFGSDIKINARFDPEKRVDRLLAIGSAQLSLTSAGFEQYFALANSISDQTLDERHRSDSVPCKPVDPARADD